MASSGGGPDPPDEIRNGANKMDDYDRETYLYTNNDEGPYRIYIEVLNKAKPINKFSVGALLRKLPAYRNSIDDMKYLGRSKIILFFSSWMQANSLIKEKALNEKGYVAYIPRHLVCITGVINGVDSDIDIEFIKQEIESNVQVVNVYRLNRWDRENDKKEATNRVSITFRARNLPEKIKVFGITAKVQPFVRKAELCLNCHRYGHKTDNCKSKKRCERCSRVHDENSSQCKNDVRCLHCRNSNHRSTDDECPAREREAGIKKLMARQNLTYVEARELVIPALSSNRYELLANAEEYPTISESFAKMTAGKYAYKQTNNKTKSRNNAAHDQESYEQNYNAGKRKKTEEDNAKVDSAAQCTSTAMKSVISKQSDTARGTGLNNPHTTTNTERLQAMYEKGKAHAQEAAYRSVRGELMNFYTALLQIPEVTEEIKAKIKVCTKKHLKFDNVIY